MTLSAATRLEAIHALAEVSHVSLPLGMNAIELSPEGVPVISGPLKPTKLRFAVDGLLFNAAISPVDGDDGGQQGALCQIWADIAHVPYSVESSEKRRSLLTILRNTQDLPRAHFVLDENQKILVLTETRIAPPVTAEALMHEVVLLVQEIRPFLPLIARYL